MKNNKEIMDAALKHVDEADAQLIIITSNEKSEGLLLKAGYSIAKKKKIILCIKKGIKTKWLGDYTSKIIEFENFEDLYNQLEKI
jgi:nucleoside 2-deoxyribosyltransferase